MKFLAAIAALYVTMLVSRSATCSKVSNDALNEEEKIISGPNDSMSCCHIIFDIYCILFTQSVIIPYGFCCSIFSGHLQYLKRDKKLQLHNMEGNFVILGWGEKPFFSKVLSLSPYIVSTHKN